MSEDIQKTPLPLSWTESPREPADELGLENEAGPAFPPLITVAGWIWIVLGSVILIAVSLLEELIVFFFGRQRHEQRPVRAIILATYTAGSYRKAAAG